jgi:hypothetical protein
MKKETLLEELASGEDEFDVDLMACGCRMRQVCDVNKVAPFNAQVLAEKYQLKPEQILDLLDGVLCTLDVDTRVVENLAQQIREFGTWNRSKEPKPLTKPRPRGTKKKP